MKKEKIRGEAELQFVFTPLLYLASIGAAQRFHILWSVFSYLELWAFLSGSTLCPTDLTLNVRWAKHLTYGCVQFSQLQQFTLGSKHSLIDIGPMVRSLSVLILQPIRTSCTHTVWLWLFVNEGKKRQANRSMVAQRSQVETTPCRSFVWTVKFEQPSEVATKITCPFRPETFVVQFTLNWPT